MIRRGSLMCCTLFKNKLRASMLHVVIKVVSGYLLQFTFKLVISHISPGNHVRIKCLGPWHRYVLGEVQLNEYLVDLRFCMYVETLAEGLITLKNAQCFRQNRLLWACILRNMFNSLRPSGEYMHHPLKPSLIQIMTCRLDGDKPLSEPMVEYC